MIIIKINMNKNFNSFHCIILRAWSKIIYVCNNSVHDKIKLLQNSEFFSQLSQKRNKWLTTLGETYDMFQIFPENIFKTFRSFRRTILKTTREQLLLLCLFLFLFLFFFIYKFKINCSGALAIFPNHFNLLTVTFFFHSTIFVLS